MRTGSRNTPLASVTVSKLLPDASCTAGTTTPGSAPRVASATVPPMEASCARATTGSVTIAHTITRYLNMALPPACFQNESQLYRVQPPTSSGEIQYPSDHDDDRS